VLAKVLPRVQPVAQRRRPSTRRRRKSPASRSDGGDQDWVEEVFMCLTAPGDGVPLAAITSRGRRPVVEGGPIVLVKSDRLKRFL
jgi:hypothetical protein